MASNGDENPPMSYGIAVGVSMPARIYDTLLDALECQREYWEARQRSYELLKGRVADERLTPQEVGAAAALQEMQEAMYWLQYTMQGVEISDVTPPRCVPS